MRQQLREILFEIELIKRKQVQEFLLGIGLTPGQGQARILVFVDTHPDVTQREIADACMLDVTTMSRTLDKLQKQGLIQKERDPVLPSFLPDQPDRGGKGEGRSSEIRICGNRTDFVPRLPEEEIENLADQLLRIKENLLK